MYIAQEQQKYHAVARIRYSRPGKNAFGDPALLLLVLSGHVELCIFLHGSSPDLQGTLTNYALSARTGCLEILPLEVQLSKDG